MICECVYSSTFTGERHSKLWMPMAATETDGENQPFKHQPVNYRISCLTVFSSVEHEQDNVKKTSMCHKF